jgi:GNAT superfamily N-acetyltransferase
MHAFLIRPAVHSDAAEIYSVHMTAIRELGASHYSAAQLAAWCGDRSPASYAAPIAADAIVVAIDSSAIVGFGQLSITRATVEAVYVQPSYAYSGVGRQLVTVLERRALAAGVKKLELDASLNAEGFYAACGYLSLGRATHELGRGVFMPCVRMVKTIAVAGDV